MALSDKQFIELRDLLDTREIEEYTLGVLSGEEKLLDVNGTDEVGSLDWYLENDTRTESLIKWLKTKPMRVK